MKKNLSIIILLAGISLILASCTNFDDLEEDELNPTEKMLIGTWTYDHTETLQGSEVIIPNQKEYSEFVVSFQKEGVTNERVDGANEKGKYRVLVDDGLYWNDERYSIVTLNRKELIIEQEMINILGVHYSFRRLFRRVD